MIVAAGRITVTVSILPAERVPMPRSRILLLAGICIALAFAIAAGTGMALRGRDAPPTPDRGRSTGQADIGGPFRLTDTEGRTVDESVLRGKWTTVFFGFTYCPDVCPTTLQTLKGARERLGARAADLQTVFISLDPERDSPEALKAYLASDGFPRGVIGLTGAPDEVAVAARAYRIFYEKVGEGPDYTLNHSTYIYLMDPRGRFHSVLGADLGPERAAQLIEAAMRR